MEEALAPLAPRLQLQPEGQQGPFKVSYLLTPPPAGLFQLVQERLRGSRLAAHAQLVDHWYLDVLPQRASRSQALEHLERRWGVRLEPVLGTRGVAYGAGASSLPPVGRLC